MYAVSIGTRTRVSLCLAQKTCWSSFGIRGQARISVHCTSTSSMASSRLSLAAPRLTAMAQGSTRPLQPQLMTNIQALAQRPNQLGQMVSLRTPSLHRRRRRSYPSIRHSHVPRTRPVQIPRQRSHVYRVAPHPPSNIRYGRYRGFTRLLVSHIPYTFCPNHQTRSSARRCDILHVFSPHGRFIVFGQ